MFVKKLASLILRQKGKSQNGCFKKTKHGQIFRKTNVSYPLIRTPEGKKCSFFGKLGVLCFLETPLLRFALLPYYRRLTHLHLFPANKQCINQTGS